MATKKQSYETLMKKLEEIVFKMENEELTLQDRMKFYEEGMKITENLNTILSEMEGKISILNKGKEEEFLE